MGKTFSISDVQDYEIPCANETKYTIIQDGRN